MKIEVRNQAELDEALAAHNNGWDGNDVVLAADVRFVVSVNARVEARESSQPHVVARGSSQPHVEAWGSSQPHVVARESSQPHVVARGSSQPHVVARESSQPHVEAWGSSQPHVEAWGSSQPHVVARGSSQPHVVAWESSQPHVEAWGSSQPHVVARGSSQPHVVARESSQPHVVARGSSQPHVVARESSQPHVEAWGSSQPHVEAWGSSQPHVVARGSSQPHVVARGYTQLLTHGQVEVDAQPTVSVVGFGTPIIKGTDRVQLVKFDTPADWCAFYGVEVLDGVAILFKALDADFRSGYNFEYAPGSAVEAPDWDGGKQECGKGLHFSPHPTMALGFVPGAKRFVGCPVALTDMRAPRDGDQYPEKIKARGTRGPVFEVDRYGKRVAATTTEAG